MFVVSVLILICSVVVFFYAWKCQKQELQQKRFRKKEVEQFGLFAYAMGHQIKNNLTNILLVFDVVNMQLEKENFDIYKKYEEKLKIIKEQCNDCKTLIEELGNFSIKEDVPNEKKNRLSLQQVYKDAVNAVKLHRGKVLREREMLEEFMEEDACVLGSRLQIQSVFMNLIDNSIDAIISFKNFKDQENYKGYIKTIIEEKDNKYYIKIVDNGIGIDKKGLKRIFEEALYTTKNSQEKQKLSLKGGSGIGAYLVRQIITKHHGDVNVVKTGQNKGTEIELWLPKEGK
jgi:signal transduction histidine kinase